MIRKLQLVFVALFAVLVQAFGQTVVFEEHFTKEDGKPGWSGSGVANGSDPFNKTDNPGWSGTKVFGGDGCLKMGATSGQGSLTTPSIVLNASTGRLTFKAGAWAGDKTGMNITATGCTLSVSSVTLADAAWTDHTIDIVSVNDPAAPITITFAAQTNSKNRFFLDDVVVTVPSATTERELSDMSDVNDLSAGAGIAVHLTRPILGNSWNAVCLPFGMSRAQLQEVFGAGVKTARYMGTDSEQLAFLTDETDYVAGTPVLLYSENTLADFRLSGVTIPETVTAATVQGEDYDFVGTFATVQPTVEGCYYFSTTAANTYKTLTSGGSIKGFRAYLQPKTADAAKISSFTVNGVTLGITELQRSGMLPGVRYNMAGQRVGADYKGLVIENGKKILNR